MVRTSVSALLGSVLLAGCVQASDGPTTTFDGLAGRRTVDTNGNVAMNGAAVTLEGRVGGWVEMNGASVDVRADIGGDLEANGASVEVDGQVAGASEINAGSAQLDGVYLGPVEVNAGNARLQGRYASELTANAGALTLEGDHAAPVRFAGQGRDRNFLGRERQDQSRLVIEGHLAVGGDVCAHEVIFERGATLGGVLRVRADAAPDLPAGLSPDMVEFEPRNGERCDSL
ncbi:hypothetical protein [Oceanicaulis alexandrii]|uniref:hypothetical protein n=1 Tax=Oceanicaulis alexandrii TaxID=153233 RepID=UPI0012EC8698|nr:hypothetical protein [Oceanicaulis alexandrii]